MEILREISVAIVNFNFTVLETEFLHNNINKIFHILYITEPNSRLFLREKLPHAIPNNSI